MPVIVVGNEKNFAALRPRLFAGKVSSKAAGEVAAEIRKANPHANLDRLTPGTVLTVPDSPRVGLRGELSLDETTRGAIAGLANFGQNVLDDVVATAGRQEAEEKKERARVQKALDGLAGDTSMRRERDLAKDLEQARGALAEEENRGKERTAALKKAQAEWAAGLEELKGLLG
jgi:hypothetical protein